MSTTQRARLAALKEFHAGQGGSGSPTMRLTDAEAVALVGELDEGDLEHADRVAEGVALLAELPEAPAASNPQALAQWAKRYDDAAQRLWDGLEGTVKDGVVITRKRS